MLPLALRAFRTFVWLAWSAATLGLVSLIVLPHTLPAIGRQAFVVQGGSMQPTIPVGSLIVVQPIRADEVRVGQVITFHLGNGTVVTHRVLGVSNSGELAFTTKGDASEGVDPVETPASALDGSVELILPGAGYLLTTLGSTGGVVASIGLLGTLLMAGWFTDELALTLMCSPKRRALAKATN